MSNSAHNEAAEEQALHDLMEGHQSDDFIEDDSGKETVHIRRARTVGDQVDDEDLPPRVPRWYQQDGRRRHP